MEPSKTNAQISYEKILELRQQIEQNRIELEELESNMVGLEINHPNYDFCMIDYIDESTVHLYAEDKQENPYNFQIYYSELFDMLS